jgi:hypothetical protein
MRCSSNPVAGGSEETNARTVAVIGRITDTKGAGVAGALAIVRPDTLAGRSVAKNAGTATLDSAITGHDGGFRFDSVNVAYDYRIVAKSGDSVAAMYAVSATGADSVVTLPDRPLEPVGGIGHTVFLEPFIDTVDVTVTVAGLDRAQRIEHGVPYRISGLPAGSHTLFVHADSFYGSLILDGIEVSPGAETALDPDTLLDVDI